MFRLMYRPQWGLLSVALLFLLGGLMLVLFAPEWGRLGYIYLFCGVGVFSLAAGISLWTMASARITHALLRDQAWRPVPVTVHKSGSGFQISIHERGGDALIVKPGCVLKAQKDVLVRDGQAWLVGPDAAGRAVLRLAGLHGTIEVRRVRALDVGPPLRPRQSVLDPGALAADDRVVADWSQVVRAISRKSLRAPFVRALLATGILAVPVAAQLELSQWVVGSVDEAWLLVVAAAVVLATVVFAARWREYRHVMALPRLLMAGPWQRMAVRMTARFQPKRSGTSDVPVVITLPDGTDVPYTLDANVDVAGYIERTGSIWLAGWPCPGRPVAVGVPGYPILGVAKPRLNVS